MKFKNVVRFFLRAGTLPAKGNLERPEGPGQNSRLVRNAALILETSGGLDLQPQPTHQQNGEVEWRCAVEQVRDKPRLSEMPSPKPPTAWPV